jgi:cytochrome o ubiquinol oxidase subunit 1
MIANEITGRLTWGAFLHAVITEGAVVGMVLALLGVAALVTYKRRWRWLWSEWLTTVDPKKLGVMYIIVAITMLVRSGADVLLMRLQQATSVGSSQGVIPTSMFQQLFSAHGTFGVGVRGLAQSTQTGGSFRPAGTRA